MSKLTFARTLLAAVATLSASAIIACFGDIVDSIHFNSLQPDYSVPPRRVHLPTWDIRQDRAERERPYQSYWGYDYEGESDRNDTMVDKAIEDLASGRNASAAQKFDVLKKQLPSFYYEPEWASIFQELGELAQLNPTDSISRQAVLLYAKARIAKQRLEEAYMDAEKAKWKSLSESSSQALATVSSTKILKPYLAFSAAGKNKSFDGSAKQFEALAAAYGNHPRAEAALIMVPRNLLNVVVVEDHKGVITSGMENRSRNAIAALRSRFPNSRFFDDTYGWLGRIAFLKGRYDSAFVQYLQQFRNAKDDASSTSAIVSLDRTSEKMSSAQANALNGLLKKNPDLLGAYLEFRMHYTEPSGSDLSRLADLAESSVNSLPRNALSAMVLARLAEVRFRQKNYRMALRHSESAIRAGGEGTDLARYVRASTLMKQGDKVQAIAGYEAILANYPNSKIRAGARENLAIAYESIGDLSRALDQYYALGFDADIAYLVDVRMSPKDLEKYIAERPKSPFHARHKYSLGLRYLRQSKFSEAQKWFDQVPSEAMHKLAGLSDKDSFSNGNLDWLQDPRITARDLAKLQRKVDDAHSENDKAQAMFEMASYYYTKRNLLQYNPAVWQGMRGVMLGMFWNADTALAADKAAMVRHHQEAEDIYKTFTLCKSISKNYPNSPIAPKALYRGACAARRLADFNSWWRSTTELGDMWAECIGMMKTIVEKYPNDPLAKDAAKYGKVFEEERSGTILPY